MFGELITLPLRVTGLAVRLYWRAAEQALSLAADATGHVIERVSPGPHERPSGHRTAAPEAPPVHRAPAPPPASARPQATSTETTPPAQPRIVPRVTEPQPEVPAEEPTHVSEEPELVEELAEPGAEDGAGAELHIREPWDGYRQMNAREVTARLSGASAAELAAVELYESRTQGRQTVLAAVQRQMRVGNGSGSQSRGGI
jgi:hypothetical protein